MKKQANCISGLENDFLRVTQINQLKQRKNFNTKELLLQDKMYGNFPTEDFNQLPGNSSNRTDYSWWTPDQESIPVSFLRDTSLHGLKYIGQTEKHLAERIFWAIAFVGSVVAAAIIINDLWVLYQTQPIIVSFQETETKISDIPFPAVTICNVNNVQKQRAMDFIDNPERSDYAENMYYLNFVCSTAASFSQKLDYDNSNWPLNETYKKEFNGTGNDVAGFLQLVGPGTGSYAQPCSKMILKCIWEGVPMNCAELFVPIVTDFGKCCTFNMIPEAFLYVYYNKSLSKITKTFENEWAGSKDKLSVENLLLKDPNVNASDYPKRIYRPGKSYGLSILLQPDLKEYLCTTADSSGFQMLTHFPTEVPRVVDYGMAIKPGTETFARIIPEVTTAEPEVTHAALDKRNCYFVHEQKLKYFHHYTTANCMDECITDFIHSKCNCTRYYMPRDPKTMKFCTPGKFECVVNATTDFIKKSRTGDCKHCLPTCTEIQYQTESTVSSIPTDIQFWIKPRDKTEGDTQNRTEDWANSNVSIVHIYFGQDSTYTKIRKIKYGTTDLIAYVGGMLGLCMGFSCLSVLEIVYFLTVRAFCKYQHRKRNRNTGGQEQQQNLRMSNQISIRNSDGIGIQGQIKSNNVGLNGGGGVEPTLENIRTNYFFGELAPHYVKQNYNYMD